MKMVSAAKLRRAQERALAARPYAQMFTNVLKSLVSARRNLRSRNREPRHPLLARRPEKSVLLIVVTGDKGLADFNTNILKAALRFIGTKTDKNLEIETIGRKGRDFLRRKCRAAKPGTTESREQAQTTIVGEQIGIFNKIDYALASELAEHVIKRSAKKNRYVSYAKCNESASR